MMSLCGDPLQIGIVPKDSMPDHRLLPGTGRTTEPWESNDSMDVGESSGRSERVLMLSLD